MKSASGSVDSRKARGQSVVEFALVLPLLLILIVAIFDLGRVYTTMLAVESAAREAADYGAYSATRWEDPVGTIAEMQRRACIASSNLPDYVGSSTDCTNPEVMVVSMDPTCKDPALEPPCDVTVTLRYQFTLFFPIGIDIGGSHYGFPETITIERTSTFRVSSLGPAT